MELAYGMNKKGAAGAEIKDKSSRCRSRQYDAAGC